MSTTNVYETSSKESTADDLILKLNAIDIIVIVLFFVVVLGVGIWAAIRANRDSVKGYFLAGKNMAWWPVGLSLYASNISSNSFIGLAGSGAASGVAVSAYELTGIYDLILLGWIFVPVYMASGICTMPEYMERRFGGQRIRVYLACLCMVLYVFTKISIDLYSGAIFIQQSLGWSLYPSILTLLAITALFAITGGLTSVIYTDALEAIIMVVGAVVLMILAFIEIGGYGGLVASWPDAIPADANGTCGIPNDDAFNIFRPANDPDYPWTGVVFGITILSTWYFCTDQVLVQRTLAAKNLTHAKGGSALAALLKVLPLFLMVLPGMISRCLYPDDIACVTPEVCDRVCENPAGCTNIAYPKLIVELLPPGVRGLMIAAILAAIMSSLTSVFNSSATIFTIDLWQRVRPNAGEREMTVTGRIFVVILTAISVGWIPILINLQSGQLFEYIQSISSYLAPPICSTYILAVFWKRMNEPGTFWGLALGLVIGVTRMIMDFTMQGVSCGLPDPRPYILSKVAFLHFAIILFIISGAISIIISLLTPPVPVERLRSLTWWTRYQTPIIVEEIEMKQENEEIISLTQSEEKPTISDPSTSNVNNITVGERILDWFCGGSNVQSNTPYKTSQALGRAAITEDSKKWKHIVNVFGIIVMCMGAYVIGYYS